METAPVPEAAAPRARVKFREANEATKIEERREDLDEDQEWHADSARAVSVTANENGVESARGELTPVESHNASKPQRPLPPQGQPVKSSSSTSAMVRAQLYQLRKMRRERRANLKDKPGKAQPLALPLEDLDTLAIAREARKKAATPRLVADNIVKNDHFVDTGGLNVRHLETAMDASEIPSATDLDEAEGEDDAEPKSTLDQPLKSPTYEAEQEDEVRRMGSIEDDIEMESLASMHDTADLAEAGTVTQVERIEIEDFDQGDGDANTDADADAEAATTQEDRPAAAKIPSTHQAIVGTQDEIKKTTKEKKTKSEKKKKKKKKSKEPKETKKILERNDDIVSNQQLSQSWDETEERAAQADDEDQTSHNPSDDAMYYVSQEDSMYSYESNQEVHANEATSWDGHAQTEHGGEEEGATFSLWDPVSGGYQSWSIHYTDEGDPFFYCKDSGESRWTDPRTDEHGYDMQDHDTAREAYELEETYGDHTTSDAFENGENSWTAYWQERAQAYQNTERSAAAQTTASTGRWSVDDIDRLEQQGFLSARSTARYAVFGHVDETDEAPQSPVPPLELPGPEQVAWNAATHRSTAAALHSAYHDANAAGTQMDDQSMYAYYGKTPREVELEGQVRYLNARAQWLEQEAFYSKEAERAAALRAEYTARTQADMVQRARHEERRRSMIDMSLITQALGDDGAPLTSATAASDQNEAAAQGWGGHVGDYEYKGEEKYSDAYDHEYTVETKADTAGTYNTWADDEYGMAYEA
ncbi:Hypothetical Protein FCC1311_100302 [Hondaea fermentalgiana]|uniref:WW domain-containing protein n=1 Tax=Hondaea fermentalgiana TaxID=2315210 RepID=A0A2R5GSE8_9STRA|nr:Hypothetical Protein FCC1311_100302 [Hondaea fermentalgiana]|eukprot:GBG33807.1 Hypothetical Protein FCC1311_100302 [Hondaea fermentalgiana]